jgi:hypothetical protein
MNDFLKILQYMNSAATKPLELLSWQASRHDKMREKAAFSVCNCLQVG